LPPTRNSLSVSVLTGSVANGCLLLTSGRIADLYGRRKVFFCGAYAYLATTIICGFAKNAIMLFIFRALQGLSSAILVPGAVGIVGATYHRYNRRKAFAFAIIGTMATTGFLAGILLGGICAQFLTWRWLFFITAMIGGIMIVSTHFIVPAKAGEDAEKPNVEKKYKEIDWWGQFLSISGLVLLAFSLTYRLSLRADLTVDTRVKRQMAGPLGISSSFSFCLSSSSVCLSGLNISVATRQ
jgi:MFS family permease